MTTTVSSQTGSVRPTEVIGGTTMSTDANGLGAVVVGTAFGCLTHVRALQAAGFEVIGLVGRDPAKTKDRAARFGIPQPSTSLDDAVAAPGVDIVAIATPPHTHRDLVLTAVAAGKHVVCEKPFAREAADARAMRDAADRAGVVHLLGTEFRWSTTQALLARTIAEGMIGEPRLAAFLLHLPVLADPAGELPDWWRDRAEGGGWLGAYATHIIDQVRMTIGEISAVSAGLTCVADRAGMTADDTYTVHARTDGGCDVVLQSTAASWGTPLAVTRVVGTGGTAWIEGDRVMLATADGSSEVAVPEDLRNEAPVPPPLDLMHTTYDFLHSTGIDLDPYTRLYRNLEALVRGRTIPHLPTPATFDDGVANQLVVDAIRASADGAGWVRIH
jgi:predicted dehydrogenase